MPMTLKEWFEAVLFFTVIGSIIVFLGLLTISVIYHSKRRE